MSDVVLFERLPLDHSVLNETKYLGLVTLNVVSTLNSLSLEMIELLTIQLTKWQEDESIIAVFFQGAGDKAFCAGGDIQALYHAMVEHPGGPVPYAETFFEAEYRLDYLIHTYAKPTIAWAHGIVMGGGLGIMGACDYRIGTQRTRIAMPEITIGLFPDAGASWLFSQMEPHWAHFLAWTGCSLNSHDALLVGFVNHLLAHEQKDEFIRKLQSTNWSVGGQSVIADTIREVKPQILDFPKSKLLEHEDLILEIMKTCLNADNPVAAFAKVLPALTVSEPRLQEPALPEPVLPEEEVDVWLKKAVASFSSGTPTTAQIIERQFRITKNLSLKEMLKIELILAVQCARHPDFTEGVRALLIEKDNKPVWRYSEMGQVPGYWIDEHFSQPWESHPLDDLEESNV